MENERFRECLSADFARMRAVAAGADLSATVPSCPEWTLADLLRHVGAVYLHKVECMRQGVEPDPWPPAGLADEDPLSLLDRGFAALTAEFDTRTPETPAGGWYTPDRTVGFWIRRMAQETVIHRLDAELGAGAAMAPIPQDLAIDGIDEFLHIFLSFGTTAWLEWAGDVLTGTDGGGIQLAAGGASWLVRPTTEGVAVSSDASAEALVTITGAPADMLRWVWGRAGDEAVTIDGDPERVAQLRKIITFVAQ
jgi:uncharacterized protein (TIGR03083 family)